MLKLYTFDRHYRAYKILVAAETADVTLQVPPFEIGRDNITPEFLNKSPLGKVPVLETPSGCIFESNAICRYIARIRPEANLFGRSTFESALVDQWIDFAANEIEPPAQVWTYPILEFMRFDKRACEAAKVDLRKALGALNDHLRFRTYFVGERMTLADIVVASALLDAFALVLDPAARENLVYLTRWFLTCLNQPAFVSVIGQFELCAKERLPPQQQKGKKGGGGGGEEKKQEKSKKNEQKQATPAPVATPAAPKKKEKTPDELWLERESTMDVDGIKRLFSNNTPEDAFKEFWSIWDPTNWRMFISTYNYNEDNTVLFMTSNLMSGYIQRLDPTRKFGFGMIVCSGPSAEQGPYRLTCGWLFKSDNMPGPFLECGDSEYYTHRQLHPESDENDKKSIEDIWSAGMRFDGEYSGLTVLDVKWFK